ncbi:MAG: hypothetical protein JNN03_12800 [Rubrivivax sp.]|nr:hypothetical protein [Rubrivivax sp.]
MNALQPGSILQSHEREILSHAVFMFSDRRHLRRWAAQMLLVWLFGLAMGVAHACALGESTHHHSAVGDVVKVASSHHDDEDHDRGQANCLDFCEKSSIGAPKLKLTDDTTTNPAFPVIAAGYATTGLSWAPSRGWSPVDSPHRRSGPPLRIAYQRLAL